MSLHYLLILSLSIFESSQFQLLTQKPFFVDCNNKECFQDGQSRVVPQSGCQNYWHCLKVESDDPEWHLVIKQCQIPSQFFDHESQSCTESSDGLNAENCEQVACTGMICSSDVDDNGNEGEDGKDETDTGVDGNTGEKTRVL